MNGREWLRAKVLRERKKATGGIVTPKPGEQLLNVNGCTWIGTPVNAAAASGAEPAPTLVFRTEAVLSEADVAAFAERLHEAVGTLPVMPQLPGTVDPGRINPCYMRAAAGTQCGCEARYSECRCGNAADP